MSISETKFLGNGPLVPWHRRIRVRPLDKVNKEKALVDMGATMYPQLQGLDGPVYLVMGAHELAARTEPARE